jgi:hypothetical protein
MLNQTLEKVIFFVIWIALRRYLIVAFTIGRKGRGLCGEFGRDAIPSHRALGALALPTKINLAHFLLCVTTPRPFPCRADINA